MVHADVFILHAPGFLFGIAQHLAQPLGDHDLGRVHARPGHGRPLAQGFFHAHGKGAGLHAHLFEDTRHDAVFLPHERKRQVFDVGFLMAHARRDALRLGDGLAGLVGKFVDVHKECLLAIPCARGLPCRATAKKIF